MPMTKRFLLMMLVSSFRWVGELLAGRVVCREQCVVEDEAGDVVSEREPGDVIEPCVHAGVDAAQSRLVSGGTEAVEGARHAGQRGRGDRERLVVAEEAGEHVGTGCADGALR